MRLVKCGYGSVTATTPNLAKCIHLVVVSFEQYPLFMPLLGVHSALGIEDLKVFIEQWELEQ